MPPELLEPPLEEEELLEDAPPLEEELLEVVPPLEDEPLEVVPPLEDELLEVVPPLEDELLDELELLDEDDPLDEDELLDEEPLGEPPDESPPQAARDADNTNTLRSGHAEARRATFEPKCEFMVLFVSLVASALIPMRLERIASMG